MKNFSTIFKIWRIQLNSRLPPLIKGVEETVYTVPRLLYGLYSVVTLLYWSVMAMFSTVILVGSFSYQLGAGVRRYLQPSAKTESGLLDATSPIEQPQSGQGIPNQHHLSDGVKAVINNVVINIDTPSSTAEIAIADLTPNAIKKVNAMPPDQTVWVRRWGKGWQVAAANAPLDNSSWLAVKREKR